MKENQRHILSILMENQPGALSRVVGLFSARNFNIESLSVAPTDDDSLSRLTLSTNIAADKLDQVTKQLNKLIDVVKVIDVTHSSHIERDFMLVKVSITKAEIKSEVLNLVNIFRGTIVDVSNEVYVIQLVGTCQKIDAFLEAISPNMIIEVVRTGAVGVLRGNRALKI
jgi:acetolactate synthase-1/3 small subunit